MICQYCDEPILPGEGLDLKAIPNLHSDCLLRMAVGSAAHQLGECSCFGGTRADPPGMTKREAARLAADTFERLQRTKV